MNYSDKVIEHFKNPRNMGRIEDYDGLGEVGNPVCSDMMYVYIKVKKVKEKGEIKEILDDIKVETFGCAAAIASASAMTEMMMGKTIEEGMKLSRDDVANYLGGLPPNKLHCSNLSSDGLHLAIENYLKKKHEKEIEEVVEEVEDEYKGEESDREDYEELDKEWKKFSE